MSFIVIKAETATRNLRCGAAKKFALRRNCKTWPMSDIRPETNSADRLRAQGARTEIFVHVRHAIEQFPSCVRTSAISDCQHSPLRYDAFAVRDLFGLQASCR
jgi:hypothetical protein